MIDDRELSALVAEKVMGWSRGTYGHWLHPGCDQHIGYLSLPEYATDAGLALEAAMKGNRFLALHTPTGDRPLFKAISAAAIEQGQEVSYGSTMASALCLAALRAAGVEVEDDAESGKGGS